MVCLTEDEQTICTIHDTTPGSSQKKISIIVRPNHTVAKVIHDIKTQFSYENFDLILQPPEKEQSIYLNDKKDTIFYKLPGFVPKIKNILILSPPDTMLSTSELSSVTIQSKIKVSTVGTKQSLKNYSTNINDKINKSTKNLAVISSSTISNGDALHVEEANLEISKDCEKSSKTSFKEKSIDSVNISETFHKISAAITEKANTSMTMISETIIDCPKQETNIPTLVSTVEIQPTKQSEPKCEENLKKSPPKKLNVKKKISTSETKIDGSNKTVANCEENESKTKSVSTKKVVVKKKIVDNTTIESNLASKEEEIDKEKKNSVKKISKITKKSPEKTLTDNVSTVDTALVTEENVKKSSKKNISTSVNPKDNLVSVEVSLSETTSSKEISYQQEKSQTKSSSSIKLINKSEMTASPGIIPSDNKQTGNSVDDKPVGRRTIILKSKKITNKINENCASKQNVEGDTETVNDELSNPKISTTSVDPEVKPLSCAKIMSADCEEGNETKNHKQESNIIIATKESESVPKLIEMKESCDTSKKLQKKSDHNSKVKISKGEGNNKLPNSFKDRELKKSAIEVDGVSFVNEANVENKFLDKNSRDCVTETLEKCQQPSDSNKVDEYIYKVNVVSNEDLLLDLPTSSLENVEAANELINLDSSYNHVNQSDKESHLEKYTDLLSDDDLALGASASPTEPDFTETTINVPVPPALPMFQPIESTPSTSNSAKLDKGSRFQSNRPPNCGYVGLVNQAMTCYLNSLLQALFMTPEFRNALYKCEFDNSKDDIIPYQLQRLFLNLQTSTKNAVETTDLTKSFGWDSTEAWQQHDIQELCRVMFDALEHKFKNTDQANLINILYEGKMIDYVKCLECKTEKSREDTFLDIPLPVRPFGSVVAYGSIEEALRAFVQPEILDGNNQYFCEKCNKKCDAHKGLKFKKFPYILTLHLKRFDFDYQTLHRIKLNDKVTFPQMLNLNGFTKDSESGMHIPLQSNNTNQTNGYGVLDDCSTTDSGTALEEDNCSGIATTASSSHHENELQEDDEGIDTSNGIDGRLNFKNENGPFLYELFAIMIHSGSASGGHYYAYIKEFENGEWYSFNDQTVTYITQEDIQKSFGGGSFKAYYSNMYSSSTNAYMLMYRQIDGKKNEKCIKVDKFPEHIKKLLEKIKTDEETKKVNRNYDSDIIRQKVYFFNPILKQMKDAKIYVPRDFDLESALDSAYTALKVSAIASIERCRLVAYDHNLEEIECSFEGREKEEFGEILKTLPADIDFLLEIREPDEEFEKYKSGGVTIKVFVIDLNTNDLDGPYSVRVYENEKLGGLKKRITKKLHINSDIFISINNYYSGEKVYVTKDSTSAIKTEVDFKKFVESNFSSVNCFFITIPVVENENLEVLGIPYSLEDMKIALTPRQSPSFDRRDDNGCGSDVVDAVVMNGMQNSYSDLNNFMSNSSTGHGDYSNSSANFVSGRCSPPQISISQGSSTGSNSEDSSLSDGDRTLVESNPRGSSQVSSTSHSPQLSSPEDENLISNKLDGFSYTEKFSSRKAKGRQMLNQGISSDDEEFIDFEKHLYFRACNILSVDDLNKNNLPNSNTDTDTEPEKKQTEEKVPRTLKVFVDKYMKVGSLKIALEPYVNVSAEYFKIIKKQSDPIKNECPKNQEDLSVFKDGEQLVIEIGREAKKGERKAKIYFMRRKELNDETGKLPVVCEFIFKLGMLAIEAKKQLVAQLHRIDSKYYETLTLENCRLWEKSGRNPIKILPDDYKLGDLKMSINCEFIVQECDDGVKTTTSENSLTLFVRRWYPSKYVLGEYEEITLEKNSEIRKVLSSISQIPEDHISFAKVNSSAFPCNNIYLLTLNTSLSWLKEPMTLDNYPLLSSICGCVYIYKDNTEPLKELTPEERKELSTKEKARLDRLGGTIRSLYSPRRERALKIYLDSPSKCSRDD
ncbi:ubiquitin carboxyl-terminal hydrolase 47 [Condylostylus longicornis]|uniref:ubiquitin carboxyl-terminal hydrolase 47 n=1 Tax=Condylostylus longicornis TaxID=2530218 RepID=UPI00244DF42F|nr:ubiquitin carboxyl-terminal hydrolase 47 [Condylostylus longicornis]XP_055385653.1 ubiquitin carboxyl-terminal hydrolase 47 [Condylostylus longicornis]XP_055385654.1 ubiquitin carboxyl-terminal hydrolase 47 [Condylostylus longicornis]XP_055385655.1 ubiquitin carboxyl-terminal hydrolase 47 [Condylostylus longicornis]